MGGTIMNVRLAWALFSLLLLGAPPLSAQSSCSDCLDTAEFQMRQCLNNAIGPNERNQCLETQQAQIKDCSSSDCKVEREEIAASRTQPTPGRPGLMPYTPSEGEWLALIMRAGLRREPSPDRPYSLDVILVDPVTLQIIVRHAPTVDRETLNKTIEAARESIRSTARGYGWDSWVKIRENVEVYLPKK
jgi:hypothetical protein